MTENRRIWLNVAATYARNVYSLALGLVTARWLLLSLGQVDYGLFGVVGGLIALVTFVNRLLSGAVARFYAVSIGSARRDHDHERGLQECRRWFSVAVTVHTLVPLLLVSIGLPLGIYAVDHWLVIPPDRVAACHWVWIFACVSAFVGMVNVPFRGMYTAKQEIAELTVLNVANATLNAVLLYYMVSHPGDWLAKYAFWHCMLGILPRVLICARALIVYPECRIRRECLWNWRDIVRLASFAGWTSFGALGKMLRTKGTMVLVNLMYGPAQNAAVAVATRLASRANTFSQSIVTSFSPAIIAAYGAGSGGRTMGLVRRVSKLGGALVIIASLPLVMEVQEVMRIWLKKPPSESPFLCSCVIVGLFLERVTSGEYIAISASGRVAAYQILIGMVNLLAIPLAWLMMTCGMGLASVGYAVLLITSVNVVLRVVFAQRQAGVSAVEWVRRVAFPLTAMIVAGISVAWMPRLMMESSFWRVVITGACSEAVMIPFAWFVVIDGDERAYVREKLAKAVRRIAACHDCVRG